MTGLGYFSTRPFRSEVGEDMRTEKAVQVEAALRPPQERAQTDVGFREVLQKVKAQHQKNGCQHEEDSNDVLSFVPVTSRVAGLHIVNKKAAVRARRVGTRSKGASRSSWTMSKMRVGQRRAPSGRAVQTPKALLTQQ